MRRASLVAAVSKLAVAGEQAGFSLEHMIQLLDAGLSVETRFVSSVKTPSDQLNEAASSCWIM
jgi:hypothetical protein